MSPSAPPLVRIHYLRPPDRREVFEQHLLHDGDGVKVTYARAMSLERPLRIGGRVALESGSEAVWFTFPGAWHDIGLFHRADGTPTGTYANVLTPPTFHPGGEWRNTDLFLDLWRPRGGRSWTVLDREELAEAAAEGWVDEPTRRRAEEEAKQLVEAAAEGSWPPPVVAEWTLARARRAFGEASPEPPLLRPRPRRG